MLRETSVRCADRRPRHHGGSQYCWVLRWHLKMTSILSSFDIFWWKLYSLLTRLNAVLKHHKHQHIGVGRRMYASQNWVIIGSHNGHTVSLLSIWSLGTWFIKLLIEMQEFSSKQIIWPCLLQNGGHFVSTSLYEERAHFPVVTIKHNVHHLQYIGASEGVRERSICHA